MTPEQDIVVGIDLGTTNSSVACVIDGQPKLIPVEGQTLLPSVVGRSQNGELLVGQAARNQYMLYPERTVRSVKRQMGQDVILSLGDEDKGFSPVEISAMILKKLKGAAEKELGHEIRRAVITVPAYFSDAQRSSTKEAGEVAGFVVERILNEPTAAALCYGQTDDEESTALVYDLGGGTFDVSIVKRHEELTEVLASHGNTSLGGDDFDAALLEYLRQEFGQKTDFSLEDNFKALARLSRAAEQAKIALSTESYVQVTEEHLATKDGVGLHLDAEITRTEYEDLIRKFIERTKDSVQVALHEAGILARDLDEVILVGGSTRTPMVSEMLRSHLDLPPRMDINPDEAVALGAALQAARISGIGTEKILVDVTPFTFGTSYLGFLDGRPCDTCYRGIIQRNTPLPTRQTHVFYTVVPGQEAVEARIYQGESEDARDNLMIGKFMVDGLDQEADEQSPILFDFKLNLNGILEVEVTEKHTGLKKGITIEDAFRKLSVQELREAQNRLRTLWGDDEYDFDEDEDDDFAESEGDSKPKSASEFPNAPDEMTSDQRTAWSKATSLIEKAERMVDDLEKVDRIEVEDVANALRTSMEAANFSKIEDLSNELADILFYLE